jgi:hypothetical protein
MVLLRRIFTLKIKCFVPYSLCIMYRIKKLVVSILLSNNFFVKLIFLKLILSSLDSFLSTVLITVALGSFIQAFLCSKRYIREYFSKLEGSERCRVNVWMYDCNLCSRTGLKGKAMLVYRIFTMENQKENKIFMHRYYHQSVYGIWICPVCWLPNG